MQVTVLSIFHLKRTLCFLVFLQVLLKWSRFGGFGGTCCLHLQHPPGLHLVTWREAPPSCEILEQAGYRSRSRIPKDSHFKIKGTFLTRVYGIIKLHFTPWIFFSTGILSIGRWSVDIWYQIHYKILLENLFCGVFNEAVSIKDWIILNGSRDNLFRVVTG